MPAIIFGWESYFSTTGSDTSGDGSLANPYRTVGKALAELASVSQSGGLIFSPPPTAGSRYFNLRAIGRAGTYAEGIISASQPFPGDPNSVTNVFESVRIEGYAGEIVTLQPPSGTNVLDLTVNNSGAVQGPSCFVQFLNILFDGVNVSGDVVNVGSLCHHNTFYQCEVINGPSNGVALQAGTHDNVIRLSQIHDNGGNGVSDAGDDNITQDNFCHDNTGDGIDIVGVGVCERNRVYANLSSGILCGMTLALVRNNLIYDNSVYGVDVSYGLIYNNTCYNNTTKGINVTASASPINNICYLNGTNSIGTGSNNLDNGTNPLFVNAGSSDFHLLSTSPAINTGMTLSDVPADADFILRPQGAAFDIGAYEYIPYAPSPILTVNGKMAIKQGRACSSPMDYRDIQATLKSGSGSPKTGIALCVDAASTPTSFTGYVFMIDPAHATYQLKMEKYVNQSLSGLGTQLTLTAGGGTLSSSIGKLFTMMVGTNPFNSGNNNLMANRMGNINIFSNDTAISRANLGYGIVGIGNTVSISQAGDDITVTTEDGTAVWTSLSAGCMNSLVNIAAFDETFHFNTALSFNKTNNQFDSWQNYGIQSAVDIDIRSHCNGHDCYGALWAFVYNYGEINPHPEDLWGDGLEIEAFYGGIVQGSPRTGIGFMLRSGFVNAEATLYGVVVDETDHTIKLVRWQDQSLQTYGTILASVPYIMQRGYGILIWLINDGSIRAAGDPAEILVWVDPTGTSSYGTEIIDYFDPTPFGQIAEGPNELMRWKNTSAGFISVGTQSNNLYDIANWMSYISLDQLL